MNTTRSLCSSFHTKALLALGLMAFAALGCTAAKTHTKNAAPPPSSIFGRWSYSHEQLEAMVPKARPEDVATPEAIVRALHDSVNGPKGPWNSDRLRSLCLPNVLFGEVEKKDDGTVLINNRELASFIKDVEELHQKTAWYESIDKVQVSQIEKHGGGLASVYYSGSTVTEPGGKPVESGTTAALLLNDGHRWWIVSDVW